ncbi:serine/threonine-protein phosphatase 4 regulatory subunit 4-like isoform X2 [Cimex lectularius]|nr:serine/threonine-protein phosphatase 4 regulatory subunit 4-like isoform X2 [Cimex lectularius]
MQSIVPKMQQSLVGGSTEYQVVASRTVLTILKDRLIPMDSFVNTFLPTILSSMDNRDLIVVNAWTETLLEAIKLLPLDVLRRQIGPVAVSRSQMGRSVNVRISSCHLLGEMALRYDVSNLKKELLPTIISLCQDVDGDVRATICRQLQKVLPQLRHEPNKTTVLSSLIELAADELLKVRESAFITVTEVLNVVGIDVVKSTMVPLIKQLVNYGFKIDDNLIPAISEYFGKMCLGIDKALGQDKELFVKYFVVLGAIGMSHSKKVERSPLDGLVQLNLSSLTPEKFVICRKNCAMNLPAMCKFAYDENSSTFVEMIHVILSDLTTDPYYMVRKTIAQGMGEICINLGKYNYLLKHDFLQLMYDEGDEVLEAFVPNINIIIDNFIKTGVYKTEATTKETIMDLSKALLKCEGLISSWHNWRLYSSFMDQITMLHKINSPDSLFNNFVTLLFKRLHGTRVVPIRLAVMRLLLTYLRYFPKAQQKTEIRNRILNEFCQSNSFYNRMFYIRSCYIIFDLFSMAYFKEHFFFRTLQLVDDPVPNIRWAMLMMLPRLKQMVKQPTEKKMATLVDSAFSKLSEDKDKEIQGQIGKVKIQMDTVDMKIFPNDGKKFEEEKKLLSNELRNDKTPQFGAQATRAVETKSGQGQAQPTAAPGAARAPAGTPSKGQPNSSPRKGAANSQSQSPSSSRSPSVTSYSSTGRREAPVSLDSMEFLIDAGVKIIPKPKTATVNMGQHTPIKKPSRSIPVLRVPKNIENRNSINNNTKSVDKRHSLEVVDLNKNIQKGNWNQTTEGGRVVRKQSQLPRPLSCINFPTKISSVSPGPINKFTTNRPHNVNKQL